MKKQLYGTLAAGKLALSPHLVNAALGKEDSTPTSSPTPTPSVEYLTQQSIPANVITAPTSSGGTGVIYANLAQNASLQLSLKNIPISTFKDSTSVQVWFVYALEGGSAHADEWLPTPIGQLQLDTESIQVLGGVTENLGNNAIADYPDTPLLKSTFSRQKTIDISITAKFNLDSSLKDKQTIYMQAIAIPMGSDGDLLWDRAAVSELDAYIIDRTSTVNSSLLSKDGISIKYTASSSNLFGKGDICRAPLPQNIVNTNAGTSSETNSEEGGGEAEAPASNGAADSNDGTNTPSAGASTN